MKLSVFFTFGLLLYSVCSFSQSKEIIAKGTATVEWHSDIESKNDAKARALQLAQDNALEQAFGTSIVRNTTHSVKSSNNNGNISSSESFDMQSSTTVKGEIIAIEKEKYKEFTEKRKKSDAQTYIKCTIEAKVRELSTLRVANEVYPLSSLSLIKPVDKFDGGSKFYVYFKSPESGYLSVFLGDGKNVSKLFPYTEMPKEFENGAPIESAKDYILFSPKHRYFGKQEFRVDEFVLYTAGQNAELNTVYFVYSKKPLNKPQFKYNSSKTKYKTMELVTPRSMSFEDFQKWKVQNLSIREDMQIDEISITITP